MRRNHELRILPLGMDSRHNAAPYGKEALHKWQNNAEETLMRNFERPMELQRSRPSVQSPLPSTIRAVMVTPEPLELRDSTIDADSYRAEKYESLQASPRSIPGGEKSKERRQGLVFQDTYDDNGDNTPAARNGPPVTFSISSRPRARTTTLDESTRPRSSSLGGFKGRSRIGSVNSAASSANHEVEPRNAIEFSNSSSYQSSAPARSGQEFNSLRKKDGGKGRLIKRHSRPVSPHSSLCDPPSVDSLPFPVATSDANKILMLMKLLCGRMKGDAEYQSEPQGPWYGGNCYIDEVKGSLMYDGGDRGPFHLIVIENLRGCRIRPCQSIERQAVCLEIISPVLGVEVRLLPMIPAETDYWLAALLCWQQMKSGTTQLSLPISVSPKMWERVPQSRPDIRRRDSILTIGGGSRESNIIKVGKLLLWDKGVPPSPSAIVRRPSTRDLHSSSRAWRRVSCILQDNGEFKLLTENDSTLLSVIQLSQLSRFAIQRLDKSVLDEDYCIAIFPQYISTSTTLSIFRPVYIALESRVLYEVWFVLLRAFAVPEIYGPPVPEDEDDTDSDDVPATNGMFRIEKSIQLRIVEAKFRRVAQKMESPHFGKNSKPEDPAVGDYFVEVMLDGEVRARTMTKYDTRNPFWREDCAFQDLPAHLPRLSLVLKRCQSLEMTSLRFLSSASSHLSEQSETVCGTIDIAVEKLDRGKELESWWPILDENKEQVGEMFLKARLDELVVLLAKDYQPISNLLHNFIGGLTIQMSQVVGQELRKMSEILMNIFQVSGQAVQWLMSLVEDEIDGIGKETPAARLRWSKRIGSNEAYLSPSEREVTVREMGKSLSGEANLLFRGNSLLTQALDFHMRRVGREYLCDVLEGKIIDINTACPDCEVDPSRLSPGDDLQKNWATLITLTTSIWDRMFASVNRCPAEIRTIMKYIRAVSEDRYGDFLRIVQYTSVSGFLFLRFFCPAILNPKLFGLLPDHPLPKAQRALTLVAKSLQVLANLSKFGQKEEWMVPMNTFLTSHRQDVKDYIDEICSIPAERSVNAAPASYSTPVTILARLPPTSREGFPSLPFLIDNARNFAGLVKLWLEATVNVPPESFEGELLEFNNHCISLQRRTDECLVQAESGEHTVDQLALQWDDMVDSLDSMSLQSPSSAITQQAEESENEPEVEQLQSPLWTEFTTTITAGRRSAMGSRGSDIGRKERQSFWEHTFGKDRDKDSHLKDRRPSEVEIGSQSPPGRVQVRNSAKQRSFLSGLRRKGKAESATNILGTGDRDANPERFEQQGWHTGAGGMI